MKKAFYVVALCLLAVFAFVSCKPDPAATASSPAIRGSVWKRLLIATN